ncbi:MAG: STAS domain-containing protein [Gammaproteobacteria bacterium]|jgi:phospholipid transport system transporter-binding protein
MTAEAQLRDLGNGRWLLQGELGFDTVLAVLEHAGADMTDAGEIEVDLRGVTRADSAGLALLIEWLRESERRGNRIAFVNVPVQLMSIARVCGLDEILSLSME